MPSFVRRWFQENVQEPVKPHLSEGQRVYCIGDIHGRLDLLQQLHQMMMEDAANSEAEKTVLYLGDYIDRGEQSKEVIDLLLEQPLDGFVPIHLMGNHEQTLLDFLRHPRAVSSWLTYGGRATLHSYGVSLTPEHSRRDYHEIRDGLESRLPQSHLEFFENLRLMYQAGSYFFVHAGIRPGVPLQEQRNEDLLWIREDFTESREIHDYIVVHGHSIKPEAEILPNRIGIDTGAFHTGVLTCLVLEGEQQRLLQTGKVVVS